MNDKRHREGGLPAVELANGGKEKYVNKIIYETKFLLRIYAEVSILLKEGL